MVTNSTQGTGGKSKLMLKVGIAATSEDCWICWTHQPKIQRAKTVEIYLVGSPKKYKYSKGFPLHKWVVEGLGYVPGVCWNFLTCG